MDLFLLIVDRDCDRSGHAAKLSNLEQSKGDRLVGVLAVQEVENWMLALHRQEVVERFKTTWSAIRAHCDPKEAFAEPLLEYLGASGPGNGRRSAMRSIKSQWKTLCELCPEIRELREKLRARLGVSN